MMNDRACRVGICGRNDQMWEQLDYQVIGLAKIESIKMMSHTSPDTFWRLNEIAPDVEIVTRLYDDRFGIDHHPTSDEFVDRMVRTIRLISLGAPNCNKFEVHNEPNHPARYEGWGNSLEDAKSFNDWFLLVYNKLKAVFPAAQFFFPGLAIPHNDLDWARVCEDAIQESDGLCVHCYWQTPPGQERNHLSDTWGLRFKAYHELYPAKDIYLTEVGNSNAQSNIPISEEMLAVQYREHLEKCFEYDYVKAWHPFILSSPDPNWDSFAWRTRDGRVKPVVKIIGQMVRPPLVSSLLERLQQRLDKLEIERNDLLGQIKHMRAKR